MPSVSEDNDSDRVIIPSVCVWISEEIKAEPLVCSDIIRSDT